MRSQAEIEAAWRAFWEFLRTHDELGEETDEFGEGDAERMRAAMGLALNAADAAWIPPQSCWYWRETIGEIYTPVKHGKNAGSHPLIVKEALDGARGTPTADVIVALIWWNVRIGEREREAWKRVAELEKEAAWRPSEPA